MSWPLAFSRTGAVVACRLVSARSPKECIGIDGRRGEEFDRVGPPVVSGDGKRVAYRAQDGARSFLVVDGKRGPGFAYMTDPAISAGGRVVYAAKDEGRWWLIHGEVRRAIDHQPSGVFVSPDGTRPGYWYDESPSRVRVAGERGETYSLIGAPVASPDGSAVAYAADDGPRRYIVVGDRKVEVEGRESDPVFSLDGRKVGYGARLGREIWWKVLDAP